MDPNAIPSFVGIGVIAIVFWIVLAVLGFVVSAFFMSLYVRLVIRFSRKALDREYRFMRGDYSGYSAPLPSQSIPREW